MIEALSIVRLPMPEDRDEMAREFYGEVLGLTELTDETVAEEHTVPAGALRYRLGDGTVIVLAPDQEFTPCRLSYPVLGIRDREGTISRLEEYLFAVERTSAESDVGEFYVFDPFGNRVAFHVLGTQA